MLAPAGEPLDLQAQRMTHRVAATTRPLPLVLVHDRAAESSRLLHACSLRPKLKRWTFVN
jgi:hypothetical protein